MIVGYDFIHMFFSWWYILGVNDILVLPNYSIMNILLRKCFLETDRKGLMPKGWVVTNYGEGLQSQGEAIVFPRHLGWKESGVFKKPKVEGQECREQRG